MRVFSVIGGFFMNRAISRIFIKKFVRKNQIDLTIYEDKKYKSYNDFFTRKLKKLDFNNQENILISPCDAKLSVFVLKEEGKYNIKNSYYQLKDLLKDEELATKYYDGYLLVYRLEVDDYHRYIYFDGGSLVSNKKIKGRFHTVNPLAFKRYDVFKENTREYSIINSNNFGTVVQMEVGALMVGKIKNNYDETFIRGQEKGMFLFGGSTVIVLIEKDQVVIDDSLIKNSSNCCETIVKIGERVGIKK